MVSLRWVADGIEAAEACGGITLDRRPGVGFVAATKVVQRRGDITVSGFEITTDPEPYEDEE